MDKRKLLLIPWSPSQDEDLWPAVTPVWIGFKGIPYHCWSRDILISIVGTIGKPLRLDEIIASQRMLSFARVLVSLNVANVCPSSIIVELEGDGKVEGEVHYENVMCLACLS